MAQIFCIKPFSFFSSPLSLSNFLFIQFSTESQQVKPGWVGESVTGLWQRLNVTEFGCDDSVEL